MTDYIPCELQVRREVWRLNPDQEWVRVPSADSAFPEHPHDMLAMRGPYERVQYEADRLNALQRQGLQQVYVYSATPTAADLEQHIGIRA